MMSRMWVMYLIGALTALLFTYVFIKGREGKGISEGVRLRARFKDTARIRGVLSFMKSSACPPS
jgi:hypothetical protein